MRILWKIRSDCNESLSARSFTINMCRNMRTTDEVDTGKARLDIRNLMSQDRLEDSEQQDRRSRTPKTEIRIDKLGVGLESMAEGNLFCKVLKVLHTNVVTLETRSATLSTFSAVNLFKLLIAFLRCTRETAGYPNFSSARVLWRYVKEPAKVSRIVAGVQTFQLHTSFTGVWTRRTYGDVLGRINI